VTVAESDTAVTVIGGYLGAGKTTLVNHILRTADERIAVLVNDFGDINIDEDLIASQDGDTISLANGCICCSLVDGFAAALETVQALDRQPERLVIESSGVADPATVAAYGHGPGLTLDATIVVVDAEMIRRKARDEYVGDTVLRQLGSGDIVIMNKIDLVSPEQAEATEQWLRERCPDAVIVGAANGVVDPALLFGVVDRRAPADNEEPNHDADSGADHADHVDHHHADSLFDSWSWTSTEPVQRSAVESMMEAMPDDVVRAKGLLVVADEPEHLMALQRVGRRWTLRRDRPLTTETENRLVVIGLHDAISDSWIAEYLS